MKSIRTVRRPQLASLDFGTNNGLLSILNVVLQVFEVLIVPLIELFRDLFASDES